MNQVRSKPIKRAVNGVLLLDKALNITSNTALQQVKRLYRAEKAGHTGVLDPLATGLLPICFGEATKFAQYLLDADKAYVATLKFGERTETGDVEGAVVATAPVNFDEAALTTTLQQFEREIEQLPPMYSALKHQGKALYEYARQGIEIERKKRLITIHQIKLLSCDLPVASIDVLCSKGTYIRTLAEDIAKAMDTEAHLIGLRRSQTAGFTLAQSHDFEALSQRSEADLDALLLPCDVLVAHLPRITLDETQVMRLQLGQSVHLAPLCGTIALHRVYSEDERFIGLVNWQPNGLLKVARLMSTAGE